MSDNDVLKWLSQDGLKFQLRSSQKNHDPSRRALSSHRRRHCVALFYATPGQWKGLELHNSLSPHRINKKDEAWKASFWQHKWIPLCTQNAFFSLSVRKWGSRGIFTQVRPATNRTNSLVKNTQTNVMSSYLACVSWCRLQRDRRRGAGRQLKEKNFFTSYDRGDFLFAFVVEET